MVLRTKDKKVPHGAGGRSCSERSERKEGLTMAKASNDIIKRQYNAARRNMANGFILDNSNLDLIPEGIQFVALRNLTIQINSARETGRRAELVIAASLYRAKCEIADLVQSQKVSDTAQVLLRWNDVRDYASEMFGYQKSVAYSLANVGEKFLHEDGTLKHPYVELSSCGASVLGLLTSMDDAEIFDLIDRAKDANKRVTASFIREYKKALKSGSIRNEIEPASEPASEPATITDNDITFEPAPMDNFDVIAKDGTLKVIIHRASGDIVSEFDRRDKENVIAYLSRLF